MTSASGSRPQPGKSVEKAPVTSLVAQLAAKDRQIHSLEVAVSKSACQFEETTKRSRAAALESNRAVGRLEMEVRKFEAAARQQTTEKQALQKQVEHMKRYIDALERRIVDRNDTPTSRPSSIIPLDPRLQQ